MSDSEMVTEMVRKLKEENARLRRQLARERELSQEDIQALRGRIAELQGGSPPSDPLNRPEGCTCPSLINVYSHECPIHGDIVALRGVDAAAE